MAMSMCLSVRVFVRLSPPASYVSSPVSNIRREIYASGGGLPVAFITRHACFWKQNKLNRFVIHFVLCHILFLKY